MLGLKVTPERRVQSGQRALKEIAEFKARLVLLGLREDLGPLDLLALKVCRAFLAWWERRARRDLLAHPSA